MNQNKIFLKKILAVILIESFLFCLSPLPDAFSEPSSGFSKYGARLDYQDRAHYDEFEKDVNDDDSDILIGVLVVGGVVLVVGTIWWLVKSNGEKNKSAAFIDDLSTIALAPSKKNLTSLSINVRF